MGVEIARSQRNSWCKNDDVAQSTEGLPSIQEALSSILITNKLGIVVHAYNPSTQ